MANNPLEEKGERLVVRMRMLPVVVGDPPANLAGDVAHLFKRVQIHAFLLEGARQPLDRYIVQPPAFAVHGSPNARGLQSLNPIPAGELASLDALTACPTRAPLPEFMAPILASASVDRRVDPVPTVPVSSC